jgi:hypothetical protein
MAPASAFPFAVAVVVALAARSVKLLAQATGQRMADSLATSVLMKADLPVVVHLAMFILTKVLRLVYGQ